MIETLAEAPIYGIETLAHRRARVILMGSGRGFAGWLDFDAKTRRTYLVAAVKPGDPRSAGVRLPRDVEVTHWRPVDPAIWPYPLPEPVTSRSQPRMWSAGRRQHEIDLARSRPPADNRDDSVFEWPAGPYGDAGSICRREAEVRLIRAIRTDGLRANADLAMLRNDRAAQAEAELGGTVSEPERIVWKPTHRDVSDEGTGMAWFCALHPMRERAASGKRCLNAVQKVVALRSEQPQWSWRSIGDTMGRSHEWSRQRYGEAMDTVWSIANAKR